MKLRQENHTRVDHSGFHTRARADVDRLVLFRITNHIESAGQLPAVGTAVNKRQQNSVVAVGDLQAISGMD